MPGSFTYNPAAGTLLGAGNHTLSVTFTPADSTDYTAAITTTQIVVARAAPVINWKRPATITFGTALGSNQLNATTDVPGSSTYNPAAGTVLGAGTQTLSVTFTPIDSTDYTSAIATTQITVARAVPVTKWNPPASITFGTALGSSQLNASANVPGTFRYKPGPGTILGAGTQTLSVTFTPTDSTDYTSAIATTQITVARAVPVTKWNPPASITYGTALGSSQLNASANVPGSFAYTPRAGTILSPGTHTLFATFTPKDATDYVSGTVTTAITVASAFPPISWNSPASITYGTVLASSQLDAAWPVPNSVFFSPGLGVAQRADTHTIPVLFVPVKRTDYIKG
jgi:hypothetical protein